MLIQKATFCKKNKSNKVISRIHIARQEILSRLKLISQEEDSCTGKLQSTGNHKHVKLIPVSELNLASVTKCLVDIILEFPKQSLENVAEYIPYLSGNSFMELPALDVFNDNFFFSIDIRPESPNGLILYWSHPTKNAFISLYLLNGVLHFR